MRPDLSQEVEVQPEFYDIDPMRVVWHGNYVKYLEVVRSALLDRLDYGYPQMLASGYAWPIVDMRLKYVRPAMLAQRLLVRADIVEWESRLRIAYVVRDLGTAKKLTSAYTIQLPVEIATGQLSYASPLILLQRLGVHP